MGFSDEEYTYEFVGNVTEITKQIGNAVPVRLAAALVKAVLGPDQQGRGRDPRPEEHRAGATNGAVLRGGPLYFQAISQLAPSVCRTGESPQGGRHDDGTQPEDTG